MSPTEEPSFHQLLDILERANQAAVETDLVAVLGRTLSLSAEICPAEAGAFYLLDQVSGELVCRAAFGDRIEKLQGKRMMVADDIASLLQGGQPVVVEPVSKVLGWDFPVEAAFQPDHVLVYPLGIGGQSLGLLALLDCDHSSLNILKFLLERMVSEVHKASRLEQALKRYQRLEAMISIFGQIGSTLDREKILHLMIESARQVINAEACSLFLVDEKTGDMVLYLASNVNQEIKPVGLRVPAGKGIIGDVIQNGRIVLVTDAKQDKRHYEGVDDSTGFLTQAILGVPLRSRQVILGGERGAIDEKVIGGFEAINKIEGTFTDEDVQLLVTLANQAATVLEIAYLYTDANDLFFDVIKALTESIDAKDPYTEGHSQRVCDFSVEIARQLGLAPEVVHCIRIGSLLHDVGKIGIPDHILNKPGRLTEQEYEIMKHHPAIGARIMSQVRMLTSELPAMAEHHERLDGGGYPKKLSKEEISLAGRIVAVADVFDALTSDRPYRRALPVEEALDYLSQRVDKEFDTQSVDALHRAYLKGVIRTQKEREPLSHKDQGAIASC